MSGKTKAELVFIPSPGRGHLLATVDMAKLLIDRDERLSITVLVIKPAYDPNSSLNSYSPESNSRIRFIDITTVNSLSMSMSSPFAFHKLFMESHRDPVRKSVTKIVEDFGPNCGLAGFVIDLSCTAMIDVANEFDVPTYMFFTSGASALGLMLHFQGLRDYQNEDVTVYENSRDVSMTNQVKEIAVALERSGHRFLWSLRKPANGHRFQTPGEYDNLEEVLPEGFLERNAGIGKVIGWAPQIDILSHRAVGGFVSHCGWNSTLESMWYGVPMAVWPLSAEQQMNAFLLVKDLGVAAEIKMDYQRNLMGGSNMIVKAEEIENGIRRLMQSQSEIRVNVEAMKLRSRMALAENGSSLDFVGRFIQDVINNMS
ncbi:UNVERIFIED_CONTAM: UDP-glycosyltransferase 71E1 [Sesamum angustifolium]|uniref:UDP-glycosyltransferase 71E1 n=1 Tax=Sesamum angustifolium TaxID=2727405 RepID=A0AAW2JAY0_9LAMI